MKDTRDDQALTAEGCTVEEAAIGDAIIPVLAKAVSMPGQLVDRWAFEEGWRCGREYERRRLDAALTAALEERDAAKQIIANFTACLEEDPRYGAMRDKAERAERELNDLVGSIEHTPHVEIVEGQLRRAEAALAEARDSAIVPR